MYQILLESVWFCRRDDKNILVLFFGSQCIASVDQKLMINSRIFLNAFHVYLMFVGNTGWVIKEAVDFKQICQ